MSDDVEPFREFVEEYCAFNKLYVRWVPNRRRKTPLSPAGTWVKCDERDPDAFPDLNEAMQQICEAVKRVNPLFVAYHIREYALDARYELVEGDDDDGAAV
jgi:hypothetical protein